MKTIKCHDSRKIYKNNKQVFFKQYDKSGFEFTNEIHWLNSPLIKSCKKFSMPQIYQTNFEKGVIEMEFIKTTNDKISIGEIIEIAKEIHSIIKSNYAIIKGYKFTKKSYRAYLKKYFRTRVKRIKEYNMKIDLDMCCSILKIISEMEIEYFTITHRDMYRRNMIFSKSNKIFLLDWEFANISEPTQDLAKIIYENEILKKTSIKKSNIEKLIQKYFEIPRTMNVDKKIWQKVIAFIIIIGIEDIASRCFAGSYNKANLQHVINIFNQLYE